MFLALTISSDVLALLIISGTGLSILSVLTSMVLALSGKRWGYPGLRISLAFAGTFLSGIMVMATQLVAAFDNAYGRLGASELRELRMIQSVLCIPFALGLLAVIGTHHLPVRWGGRILAWLGSPAIAIYFISRGSEFLELGWTLAYLVIAAICWEVAVTASKQRHRTGVRGSAAA